MIKRIVLCLLLYGICCHIIQAQTVLINPDTDKLLLDRFQKAKLGLFIHWMACHSPETGDSWSIGTATPKSVSDSITMKWNPEKFNAKQIVDIAAKGGCKYLVVISKHHDGFCIWPSDYSIFDRDRITFKKDILKELGKECKRKGLLFGIYYSIADIDYCGWKSMPQAGGLIPKPKYGKNDFIQFVHNQTKELITRYNPDILWFDGHWLDPVWTPQEGKELYYFIKSLKRSVLSTRLSVTKAEDGHETFWTNGASGDFFSMEARTTDAPVFPWEACTSITYPVYAYEPEAPMLSRKDLIDMFDRTLCGNGNLLVNIGPKPDGTMPQEQVERLYELTAWISKNKEAVYDTKGGPFRQTEYLGSTYKGNKIYLHIRKPISHLTLSLPGGYKVLSAYYLETGKPFPFEQSEDRISISSFNVVNDIPVIVLQLNKKYEFIDWLTNKLN